MSTALAVINDDIPYDQVARMIGQDDGGTRDMLPRLSINRDAEDDQGRTVPAGTYVITVDGQTVYAKTAHFRPYYQGFQYRVWDPTATNTKGGKGAFINRTVIETSIRKGEFPDELGGTKCGKIAKAQLDGASEAVIAKQRAIRCRRLLYGTVRMEGVNSEGEKVKLGPTPCLWSTGGTSFIPIGDVIEQISKAKQPFFKFELLLNTRRDKTGGNTQYYPEVSVDLTKPVAVTEDDFALIRQFMEHVQFENRAVMEKHKAALKGNVTSDDKDDAEVLAALDADLNDELPF